MTGGTGARGVQLYHSVDVLLIVDRRDRGIGGHAGDRIVDGIEMLAADRNAAARFEEVLSARGLCWQSRTEEIDAPNS